MNRPSRRRAGQLGDLPYRPFHQLNGHHQGVARMLHILIHELAHALTSAIRQAHDRTERETIAALTKVTFSLLSSPPVIVPAS
jgi:hypothetical protein